MIEWLATVRRFPSLLKRLRDLDRWEAALEHREKRLRAEDENASLRARIEELEQLLRASLDLRYGRNAYWDGEGYAEENGPYCQRCWEDERKPIRLVHQRELLYQCKKCGSIVIVKERDESPPPPPPPRPRGPTPGSWMDWRRFR